MARIGINMINSIISLLNPLVSFIAAVVGSGLLTTLTPLRLQMSGQSEILIGLVSSAFYIGMTIGAFKIEPLVSRIGHIRAYSAFAAALAIATLFQGIYFDPIFWFSLRLVSGFCMSGIFIVIESWFLSSGPSHYRGRLLALYMSAMYAAQSGGQFLLYLGDTESLELFCIIGALTCFSIIPITMTRMYSPQIHEPSALKLKVLYRISPTGMIGACSAGIILSSLYSLLPVYVLQVGYEVNAIALAMGLLIFGGMILQYPIGKLSDLFDRRKMLVLVCCSIGVGSLLMIVFSYVMSELFFISCLFFGGIVFMLYPLSISHTCDFVEHKDILAATQGLLLAYGLGAITGPILSSLAMNLNHIGLFVFIGLLSGLVALFIYNRRGPQRDLPLDEQQDFAITSSTTPIASSMDSRVSESEQDVEP